MVCLEFFLEFEDVILGLLLVNCCKLEDINDKYLLLKD